MKTLLITGTDTDVGKTVLTSCLVAYWQKYYFEQKLGLMKLLQTGIGDQQLYHQLFANYPSLKIITPLSFAAPLAPPLAAEKEGKVIELDKVWQALNDLQTTQDFVFIEALGGLGSPITEELTVADLAGDWRLNTVLVVPVKLGAIAQSVANVALAKAKKINLKGIVLSCVNSEAEKQQNDWTPIDLIQSLTNVPVLGIMPYLTELNNLEKLAQVASNLDLEYLW